MSTDVMDRLRRTNPHDANDVPTLTPEREALLIVAAKSEFSGPLRRSWLVAAATGLVLSIGVIAIWFSGGSNSLLTTDENAVTSDEPIVTTETASATVTVPAIPAPIKQITPIDITCSTEFNNSSLACPNLIDGTTAYWNDLSLRGEGAVISVTFAGPVQLEQIQFINIDNDAGFSRNYRIRGIEIITDDLPHLPFIDEISNNNDRPHAVITPTLGTTQLAIRVTSTWPAEAIDGRVFDELALNEIEFWGRVLSEDVTDVATLPESLTTTAPGTAFENGPPTLRFDLVRDGIEGEILTWQSPELHCIAFTDSPTFCGEGPGFGGVFLHFILESGEGYQTVIAFGSGANNDPQNPVAHYVEVELGRGTTTEVLLEEGFGFLIVQRAETSAVLRLFTSDGMLMDILELGR